MPHINIVARTNGVGLDQDVDLVHKALTSAGMQVTINHCRDISILNNFLPQQKRFDANIFLERVFTRWLGAAEHNFLIPNQERFPKRHTRYLKKIHTILCKSRHAEEVFSPYGDTKFISFTSTDRSNKDYTSNYNSYFHLAGKSTLKGTEALLKVWERHPEWPTLTLIQCTENAPESVPQNVDLITDYVSNEDLIKHLNTHGVHLCPSLSEGWGHYIVEAMSCGATVVTTAAPPMNELISDDHGILIPISHSEPRHLGTNFYVDIDLFEKRLSELIHTPLEMKQKSGSRARLWYNENNHKFNINFPSTIAELLKKHV